MVELATKTDLLAMERELQNTLETLEKPQTLRLTLNFDAMIVVWVVAMIIMVKLI